MKYCGEKILKLSHVAELISVPEHAIKTLAALAEKRDHIGKGAFITVEENTYVSLKGVLFLYQKFGTMDDYEAYHKLIQEFFNTGENNSLVAELKVLIAKYDAMEQNEVPVQKRENSYYQSYLPMLPSATEEAKKWYGKMVKIIKENMDYLQLNFSNVLRTIYRTMRNVYGFVYEQSRKDFIEKYHLDEDAKISKIRIIQEDEQLMSIFQSILENMVNDKMEEKKNADNVNLV